MGKQPSTYDSNIGILVRLYVGYLENICFARGLPAKVEIIYGESIMILR